MRAPGKAGLEDTVRPSQGQEKKGADAAKSTARAQGLKGVLGMHPPRSGHPKLLETLRKNNTRVCKRSLRTGPRSTLPVFFVRQLAVLAAGEHRPPDDAHQQQQRQQGFK